MYNHVHAKNGPRIYIKLYLAISLTWIFAFIKVLFADYPSISEQVKQIASRKLPFASHTREAGDMVYFVCNFSHTLVRGDTFLANRTGLAVPPVNNHKKNEIL